MLRYQSPKCLDPLDDDWPVGTFIQAPSNRIEISTQCEQTLIGPPRHQFSHAEMRLVV